jgi:hypothetical protein
MEEIATQRVYFDIVGWDGSGEFKGLRVSVGGLPASTSSPRCLERHVLSVPDILLLSTLHLLQVFHSDADGPLHTVIFPRGNTFPVPSSDFRFPKIRGFPSRTHWPDTRLAVQH